MRSLINIRCVVFGVVIVCTFGTAAFGQPWSGSGTAEDPYQIWDACDMQAIGADSNYWDANFILCSDINLGEYTGTSFNIIGNSSNHFTGAFDGNDHTISNFTYSSPGTDYIGLFGYIGTGSEIKNLKLENINLEGFRYLGAVAGKSEGTIINCFSETYIQSYYGFAGGLVGENDGNVSLSSSFSTVKGCVDLGGLVGWNDGTIDQCDSKGVVRINIQNGGSIGGLVGYNKGDVFDSFSNSSVYGSNANDSGGGLAGVNSGIIERCHSNGDVRETAYSAGGLVGYNGGEINNCYSNGEVSGVYDMGGLVGWNSWGDISSSYATGNVHGEEEVGGLTGWTSRGSITNCYSSGDVNGIIYVGGLSGGIDSAGTINDCYATGTVTGTTDVGGLVGNNYNGLYTKCFWDVNVNPDVNGIGDGNDPNVIGKTTSEMQTESTFTDAGWDFVGEVINGPNDIWDICEGTNYPKFVWQIPVGDFVCPDGVTFADFSVLGAAWLSEVGLANWDPNCDISEPNDNVIDERDLAVFCENWLAGIR